ncbi:MAG: phosphotransferase [Candidatus Eremiobacteraeota bacterium]|nr:phosphotransferase [Candidatus Eremiobacteraeota bacterium]
MTETEAVAVAGRFGAPALRAEPLEGGYSNESWRAFREDGSSVVVRRYGRLHVTRRAVFFEHAVMRHAAARMTEVVAPLTVPDGDSILFEDGAFVGAVPFIEGETGDQNTAAAFAAVLARFHLAMADFHPARPRGTRSLGALAWVRNRLLAMSGDPLIARRLPWDDLMVAVSGAIARIAPHIRALPLATLHGDPHPDNVVERYGSVVGLIDFDFAHESERAYDVAAGADSYARTDRDGPLDPGAAGAFAAAYHATAPLGREELQLLPDLMIRRNAVLVWYVVSRHGRRAPGDVGNALRYARRAIELDRLARSWTLPFDPDRAPA